VRAAGLLTFLTTSLSAAPGPCGNPSAYDGYKVTKVAVIDPIGFLAPWTSLSASLKTGLKIAQNQPFSSADFNADTTALNDRLEGQFASSTQRVKLSYAYGDIVDCDSAAQSLRVVYTAITTVIPSLISSAEEQLKETVSPATTGAARAEGSGAQVSALTGYNETRGTLGGLSFADTTGILQIQGESEVSANSRTGNLNLGGSIAPHRTLLDSAVWAGTFDYRGVPVGSARFGEGTLSARFSALSKESGAGHSLFRYGAALEGGHQQSTESGATASLLPDSRYGAMKLFAGVTGRPGKQAYTASYGLQLGSTFLNNAPVFTKHLVDLGYSTRVPLPGIKPYADTGPFTGPLSAGVHRSLGIETRFTGGLIQGATGAPLAERFFGGNAVAPFVPDASWVIQSDAFIRSIPENRLGAGNGTAPYGGSRFYSGNATLSYTLFGKPLLPKEMADDPDFPGVLNAPFDTAVSALSNSYKPEFRS